MKRHIPTLVFVSALTISAAVIALALFYRGLVGMHLYDMHAEQAESLHRVLTHEQQHFIGISFDYISGIYSAFLAFTNFVWILASSYLFVWSRRKSV